MNTEATPRNVRWMAGRLGGILAALSLVSAGCGASKADSGAGGSGGAGTTDPRPALLARLQEAEATWTAVASGCATYHYARYYESFVAGTQITTVQIADEQPSLRRHWTNAGQPVPQLEWTEGPNDIGSHPTGAAGPPYPASTVSQLFAECRNILGESPTAYDLSLEVSDTGIPTTCMKRLLGCPQKDDPAPKAWQ